MNHIILAGRLGNDPEVRFTSNGAKVTSFRLATNSKRAGKEETTWWRVTLWGDNFDKMVSFLKKGSAIFVTGELAKPEIFQGKDGNSQISLNVTATSLSFSPFGKGSAEGSPVQQKPNATEEGPNYDYFEPVQGQANNYETFSDEEIPF